MGSLISELVDRVIQFLNYRQNKRREKFDLFVEPVYRKAEAVTKDLLSLYWEIIATLDAGPYHEWNSSQEHDFIESIRARRFEFEAMRQQLLTTRLELKMLCNQLATKVLFVEQDREIREMADSILFILRDPKSERGSRPKTILDSIDVMLDPVSEVEKWRDSRWFISTCIGELRGLAKSTELSWGYISESYATLKMQIYG